MTAQLIDGNAVARTIRAEVAERTAALKARGITPGLAVILVGEDPASQVYVGKKVEACQQAGMHSVLERYEATMTEADLLERVRALNADPAIHG
ncbi:tetrahydrofolate dehydrogenase/cyclohydrolase catalytic domain-containing protein, partial [uncultured Pseudacidovorax sp.]